MNTLQANIATVVKQGNTLSPEVIDERLREMRKQAELDSVVKDEQMRLIMKITVFEDHFTVGFKSGITIDIEAKNKAPKPPLMTVWEPWCSFMLSFSCHQIDRDDQGRYAAFANDDILELRHSSSPPQTSTQKPLCPHAVQVSLRAVGV